LRERQGGRARSVEIEVAEEAVGSVREYPTASLPSTPPQLQRLRLCLHPYGTNKASGALAQRGPSWSRLQNTYIDGGPSLVGSYYCYWETLACSLSPVQHRVCG